MSQDQIWRQDILCNKFCLTRSSGQKRTLKVDVLYSFFVNLTALNFLWRIGPTLYREYEKQQQWKSYLQPNKRCPDSFQRPAKKQEKSLQHTKSNWFFEYPKKFPTWSVSNNNYKSKTNTKVSTNSTTNWSANLMHSLAMILIGISWQEPSKTSFSSVWNEECN